MAVMPTSAKDRLFSLLPNRVNSIPRLPRSHFSQAELSPEQFPVPVASTSRYMDTLKPTSAEQDHPTLASALSSPQRPERPWKPQAVAQAYPDTGHTKILGEIKYFPYGKPQGNAVVVESDAGKKHAEPESEDVSLTGTFCLFSRVIKFPYEYMDDPDNHVSRCFFAANKIYQRPWDLYFISAPESLGGEAIFLVPLTQVQKLIEEICRTFEIEIGVPPYPFTLKFFDDNTPQPKFLGQSTSRCEITDLQASVPICNPSHGECPPSPTSVTQKNFAAFYEKCQMALAIVQKRNSPKKKKERRTLTVTEAANQLKRAQSYFGLRPPFKASEIVLSQPTRSEIRCSEQSKAIEIGISDRLLNFDAPVPYPFECEPVVISIDVEAWEEDHRVITEIGVSTLDTFDLVGMPPGLAVQSWINQIRSRHFRIIEYQRHVNQRYCRGNPDTFEFGQTEWIPIEKAASIVDSCFEWPFSVQFKHPSTSSTMDQQIGPRRRNLLLLGHNVDTDLAYLAALRSDIFGRPKSAESASGDSIGIIKILRHTSGHANNSATHLANTEEATFPTKRNAVLASILESLDTATLYRSLRNETNPRSLVSVCEALGVPTQYPHNAGNDARYTLEALLKLVFKARMEG